MAGISRLSCRYGGIAALKGVDLAVRDGELVTIIGPHGDDLSLGLAPGVVHVLYRTIMALHRGGMTILMVEQNARLALRASDRAYVLNTSSVVLEGGAQDLLEDEAIRKAYLG
jgi:ABC-type branched-subunit amino acid transport system ATPase component